MQKLFDEYPSLRLDDKIKTYSFLGFALFDYYKCRRQTDRAVEMVRNEDQIAGITVKKLNVEQALQGINKRLRKGLGFGGLMKEQFLQMGIADLDEMNLDDEMESKSKKTAASGMGKSGKVKVDLDSQTT